MRYTSILKVIERVKERDERFYSELQKSEALTRYVLIDPILSAPGLDMEDPFQRRPGFSTESGTPDYATFWESKPHITVEVKALGKRLEGAQDKAFQYAYQNGVPYHVATDGLLWELYDVYARDPERRKKLVVDLGTVSAGSAARDLLALWRPAMLSVEVPPQSVVEGCGEP